MPDVGLSFDLDTSSLEAMFPATKTAVRRRLATQVSETAFQVVADAQEEIQQGDKTGKYYKVSKRGPQHQASAPGEAPANLHGALANSGHVEDGESDLEKEVVFGTAYGAAMEFGTVAIGGFIEPRPFVGPACDRNDEPFHEGCRRAVAEGMAEGSQGSR